MQQELANNSNKPAPTRSSVYLLLGVLILVWGGGWPVLKVGVQYLPPLWFTVFRLGIGALCIFLLNLCTGQLRLPRKGEWGSVVVISLTQMSMFLCLLNVALSLVDAGRSVILVYTVPLWVTPVAILFFGEKLNRYLAAGLILGFIGIVLLFEPNHFSWQHAQTWLGNGLLLLTAISLATAVLYMRYAKVQAATMVLLPWQLALATLTSLVVALVLDPQPHFIWGATTVYVLLFTGFLCSAFGYWAVLVITRHLPAVHSSLGLLGVPALGFIASIVFLHESVSSQMIWGIVLLVAGLVSVIASDA